jgi:hypothetical protein
LHAAKVNDWIIGRQRDADLPNAHSNDHGIILLRCKPQSKGEWNVYLEVDLPSAPWVLQRCTD